jgi:hypothetical protein
MTVETDEAPRRMPMAPSMPDVVGNHPVAVWKAGDYLLVLVTDVKPLSARVVGDATGLHYDAALAVIDRRINYPRMYITLERSIGGQFLCRFTEAGLHENCGLVDNMSVEAFVAKAIEMFQMHFGYSGEIERAQIAPKSDTPAAN